MLVLMILKTVQGRGREHETPSNDQKERASQNSPDLPFVEGESGAQNRREHGWQVTATQQLQQPARKPTLDNNQDVEGTFQGRTKEGQKSPVQGVGTSCLVVSDSEYRNDPTGEYFRPL